MDTDALTGKVLSHYKVLEKLGEGGMGAVYRAIDTRLDRVVALKVLPAQKFGDPERKKRFVQEAKAASSLNHPNIITIYDIDTASDPNYIAMEYVAGKTLHERIARVGLPLNEALRYAVQIADALAAAHAAGIIHRDLKPGNIMVTEKGHIKVLDFGLAKLTEPVEVSDATMTIDDLTPRTMQGIIVGTAAYMSPEQAEGKKVDPRSDIFSFGTVLYEMVTGRRPFQGETTMSTLSAIILQDPSPVSAVSATTPPELERLILRCLRKEPERRVQHMDDLKVALEELRDESSSGRLISGVRPSAPQLSGAQPSGVQSPGAPPFGVQPPGPQPSGVPPPGAQPSGTLPLGVQPPSAQPFGAPPSGVGIPAAPASAVGPATLSAALPAQRTRRPLGIWIAAACALLVITTVAVWWWRQTPPSAGLPILTRLTADPGLNAYPAISPDGKLLAYASDRSGEGSLDIWLRQIGGGEPIRLTRDPADESEPAFSPDGTQVAFRSEREGGGIYVVPALGGEPRLVAHQGHRPRFSPDGNWIAYWTGSTGGGFFPGSGKIFVVPAAGGEPKQVHSEFPASRDPVWMPDSKRLLFLGRRDPKDPFRASLDWWLAPVDGGTAIRTGALAVFDNHKLSPAPGETAIAPEVISPQGDRIFFSATLGDTTNLWQVSVAPDTGVVSGSPQRATFGTNLEMQSSVTIARGGETLAFSSLTRTVNVWSLPVDPDRGRVLGAIQPLTQGVTFNAYPSISADGKKLVYISSRSGVWNVWTRDLETGRETALTAGRVNAQQPKISADGTKVAYWEVDGRKQSISIIAAAGGLPRKLCEDCGPPTHVSAHGDRMLEESQSRSESVILLDAASGKQTELARSREAPKVSPFAARFSPDEKWVVFHALANARPLARQLFIIPFRPAAPAPLDRKDWIAVTDGSELDAEAYWSPDGNLLYFLSDRDGFRCIWAQRLDPSTKRPLGSPFAVQHFHHARNSLSGVGGSMAAIGLSVAKDKLVFALGDMTGNIWMSKREGQP